MEWDQQGMGRTKESTVATMAPASPSSPLSWQPSSPESFLTDEDDLASEAQLVLLCLDHLRDLRRGYSTNDLEQAAGIDARYLSIAIYALSKSFTGHPLLESNDVYFNQDIANEMREEGETEDEIELSPNEDGVSIPDLDTINREILYSRNPKDLADENSQSAQMTNDEDGSPNDSVFVQDDWYTYDDNHISNVYRFYPLNGLASGPTMRGPLSLAELVAAGLAGLGARSRESAELEMVQSPLFHQFLAAVESKGFFRSSEDDNNEEIDEARQEELYEERYAKVVGKFRTKLAVKAAQQQPGAAPENLLALSAAERQLARRRQRQTTRPDLEGTPRRSNTSPRGTSAKTSPDFSVGAMSFLMTSPPAQPNNRSTSHPLDEQEAERLKAQGNTFMQQKEYGKAAEAYTAALKLSPAGPNSHVYFSNRAAAYLSQRQIEEAVLDSERSLALKPNYAKAHARLGLSHFLLGNYQQALEAYTISLKYDPNNVSSQRYLEKAAKRVNATKNGNWEKSSTVAPTVGGDAVERQKLVDEQEAEKHKVKGNSYMASRNYEAALDSYSKALLHCPDGPHSHVYYSNRAAALCYLERYKQAEKDSLKSLSLNPSYGKAHSRLGLARFFMGDYRGAVEAYTEALVYEPNNAASKSYLAKAKDRLQRQEQEVDPEIVRMTKHADPSMMQAMLSAQQESPK